MTHEELIVKYPKIFDKCYPSVGVGWLPIIDKLCHWLQFNTDNNGHLDKYPQVVATQVKEKFGGLRFYVESASEEQYAVIHFTEYLAGSMCEVCGAPGKQTGKGWIQTLCEEHIK